jgi:hypothetical protein
MSSKRREELVLQSLRDCRRDAAMAMAAGAGQTSTVDLRRAPPYSERRNRVESSQELSQSHRSVARMSCPSCGSLDIRRSHSRGLLDGLARAMGYLAHRCRACRARYYAVG